MFLVGALTTATGGELDGTASFLVAVDGAVSGCERECLAAPKGTSYMPSAIAEAAVLLKRQWGGNAKNGRAGALYRLQGRTKKLKAEAMQG